MTVPQQMEARDATELAAIARTTTNEHLKQTAIRTLELRAWDLVDERANAEAAWAERDELVERILDVRRGILDFGELLAV